MAIPAKRILIAPLDWGLGHTARCVPLIRYIQRQGHIPIVAGNKWQRTFIEKTFGDINFIHLDGYNITYSAWNKYAQAGLFAQLPRITQVINEEHSWLQWQGKELEIDGIISDNRYGLYHTNIPSVILTHQLQVKTGMGRFMDNMARKLHYKYLNRFSEIWVPDVAGIPNLAGTLAHPSTLPGRLKYIGLLSQFEEAATEKSNGNLVILLSGPEPQRTILSALLWKQVQEYKGAVIFIEGSEYAVQPSFIPPHIVYHKRLTGEVLGPLICKSGMVICRSGYSTIMDLVALQKKAILIPTTGQTEQEYLGKYLLENGLFYSTGQKRFNLQNALTQAEGFPHAQSDLSNAYNSYKEVLLNWLGKL